MKIAILSFALISQLLATGLAAGLSVEETITLKSGEKLPGQIQAFNPPYLTIRSNICTSPMEIKLTDVDRMDSPLPLSIPEQFSIIKLSNGDELYGTLKQLDKDNLIIQTPWGAVLPIQRSYVQHIGFDAQKAYLRNATQSLEGWTAEDNNMLPDCQNGYWIIRNTSYTTIQTKLDMPAKLHLQCTVYHTNNFKLGFNLWKSENDGNKINLSISTDRVELNLSYHNGNERNLGKINRNPNPNWYSDKSPKCSEINFYADRENHQYYLYINGEQIGKWNNQDLQEFTDNEITTEQANQSSNQNSKPFTPGNIIALSCYDNKPMGVGNLNILAWNGALPVAQASQDVVTQYDNTSSPETVTLVNGDVLRGNITLQDDGGIRVQSPHYDVTVPTIKIRSLNQKNQPDDTVQPLEQGDMQVFLTDQSTLTLTLDSLKDGKLEGSSPATGKVSIPIEAVRKILFNLQHSDLKKQRELPFLSQ